MYRLFFFIREHFLFEFYLGLSIFNARTFVMLYDVATDIFTICKWRYGENFQGSNINWVCKLGTMFHFGSLLSYWYCDDNSIRLRVHIKCWVLREYGKINAWEWGVSTATFDCELWFHLEREKRPIGNKPILY